MEISNALRDERVNVFALTEGCLPTRFSHQIILCKTKPLRLDRVGPFLLDPKRTNSIYKLSDTGKKYKESCFEKEYHLSYVAFIDSYLETKVDYELFEKLHAEGFFPLWHPQAPLKYFRGNKIGYLVVFRVYRIKGIVPDALLEKGRKCLHYYYGLENSFYSEAVAPVLSDSDFYSIKHQLITLLKSHNWLLQEIPCSYQIPVIERYSHEELLKEENTSYTENKDMSLDELLRKISDKHLSKKLIVVESKQYYRDPDIKSFALIRANGMCDCCGNKAPFIKQDGTPFLETHHLVPLALGGEDSIHNVCAVCPNCHRYLHYNSEKEEVTKKILQKLHY